MLLEAERVEAARRGARAIVDDGVQPMEGVPGRRVGCCAPRLGEHGLEELPGCWRLDERGEKD